MAIILDPMVSLTLGQAIGNIISGLVDAQAHAARTTVEFIDEVGFLDPVNPGDPPSLRTVEFTYRKRDENDQEAEFQVSLPLLGMVDIPLIAIRRATIDLEFEVSSVEGATTRTSPRTPVGSPGRPVTTRPIATPAAVLKGQILSGRRAAADQRGTITISVEVEKADLPPGLARSLDILELAATEKPARTTDG